MPTLPPPESPILASIPSAVDAALSHVPPDRKGVVVVGVEWKYGIPFARFGTAMRVGDHLKLTAEAETRFSKMSTTAKAYAVWEW